MTSKKSPAFAERDKILEEHRLIAQAAAAMADARDLDEMAIGLGHLQPLLDGHFLREEAPDGLHASIRARAPHLDAAVKGLAEAHQRLLAEARDLRSHLERCARGAVPDLRQVHESCRRLLADLQAHEARENELFLDVWTDLGTGD